MTDVYPTRLPVLPSRLQDLAVAAETLRSGGPVAVIGTPGSGRTTFARQTLAQQADEPVVWINCSPALSAVPFAVLSVLSTQLSPATALTGPTDMIAALAERCAAAPLRVLLDQAEHTDEQSAAVLQQIALTGNLRIILTAQSIPALPSDLRTLVCGNEAQIVRLDALSFTDAEVLLKDLLGGPVNVRSVTSLNEYAGGHALHLREVALDARTAGAFTLQGTHWTLNPDWAPTGERISDLVAARLADQTDSLREVLELMSLSGELSLPVASELFGAGLTDAIDAQLARVTVVHENRATGERRQLVRLSAGLSPQLIVGTLSQKTLRRHLLTLQEHLSWERCGPQARGWYTRHRLQLGLEVPAHELVSDTQHAAQARDFSLVVALTDGLDRSRLQSDEQFEDLLVARGQALYQLGQPEAALELLQGNLSSGGAGLRCEAAKIAFASAGSLDVAERLLAERGDEPVEVSATRLLVRARANRQVDVSALFAFAQHEDLAATLRAECFAQALIELCYQGQAEQALAQIQGFMFSERWADAPAAVQAEVLFAGPTLAIALGWGMEQSAELLSTKNLASAKPDHTNILIGIGFMQVEAGFGLQALNVLEQAMGLLSLHDPFLIRGYAAALAAHAACLVGELDRAEELLSVVRAYPETSGQIMRPLVESLILPVIVDLSGVEAGREYLDRQLQRASEFGRTYIRMRLLLGAWQCGLLSDAAELSAVASGVEGPLARTLSGYASALDGPDESEVMRLVGEHVASDHLLLAAQLAQQASERARLLGQRALAARLLGVSVQTAQPLEQVNTRALGRGRIDRHLLTEREFEACIRAARGESNQEISHALFLSPRTVEGHLQRSYAKLGIFDRRQLLAEPAHC